MSLVCHAMGGFDQAGAAVFFDMDTRCDMQILIAVGHPGDPVAIPESLRIREVPNGRQPQTEWVYEETFKQNQACNTLNKI